MKKVCIVTSARSEYGIFRWIIDSFHRDISIELQLVVTGAHLSAEQGLTYRFIEADGYEITEKVPMLLAFDDEFGVAKSMGVCSISFADTFNRLKPDMVVVLGDRYELLPIVSAALIMRIPIAHIGGGDVTEGAVDDEVRNAVTMMSTLHFPGVKDSADNICRMRGSNKNVYQVGEPGLDSFKRLNLMNRDETAKELYLDFGKKWCLVTLHPETKLTLKDNLEMAQNLYQSLLKTKGIQYIITKANADVGGSSINKFWDDIVSKQPDIFHFYSSLGQIRYLSLMKHVDFLIGNSSSGIVEAPFLGTPVINIGERQKGRHICSNVVCCERDANAILRAINTALTKERNPDYYWGDGNSSIKIVNIIKDYLFKS